MPEAPSGRGVIALTGATGFIGQHLQNAFLDAGYTVRALVRQSSTTSSALHPDCEVRAVDLGVEASLAAALEGTRAVVYGAGSVRGRRFEDFRLANVQGVKATAAALSKQADPAPLLLISSLAASAPELSCYAGSKAAGEQALRTSGLRRWTIIRPPAVYGPGDEEMRPVLQIIRRGLVPMLAPPEQHLPFIEISDLVRALVAWVGNSDACAGGTFAIDDGTPDGYDWGRIRQLIAPPRARTVRVPAPLLETLSHVNLAASRILGYMPMLTPGKVRELTYVNWTCDNREFSAATGWQPEIGLAEGVARLFANRETSD